MTFQVWTEFCTFLAAILNFVGQIEFYVILPGHLTDRFLYCLCVFLRSF